MSNPSSPRTPVILVVDDHADTREMYATFLGAMGLDTVGAATCAEALACVGRMPIDALVLDRRLPDGDGHDVVRALRSDVRTRELPIIVLSGDPASASINADAYLLKPIVPDILYAELKRLLAARTSS
jgi:two-component system response regulator PilR (NtrC family)